MTEAILENLEIPECSPPWKSTPVIKVANLGGLRSWPIKICNKLVNIKAPQVECIIRIRNYLFKTNSLLDRGCTHVIIDEKIIPKDFIILAQKAMVAQQADASFNHYKNQLEA